MIFCVALPASLLCLVLCFEQVELILYMVLSRDWNVSPFHLSLLMTEVKLHRPSKPSRETELSNIFLLETWGSVGQIWLQTDQYQWNPFQWLSSLALPMMSTLSMRPPSSLPCSDSEHPEHHLLASLPSVTTAQPNFLLLMSTRYEQPTQEPKDV